MGTRERCGLALGAHAVVNGSHPRVLSAGQPRGSAPGPPFTEPRRPPSPRPRPALPAPLPAAAQVVDIRFLSDDRASASEGFLVGSVANDGHLFVWRLRATDGAITTEQVRK